VCDPLANCKMRTALRLCGLIGLRIELAMNAKIGALTVVRMRQKNRGEAVLQ
jgi:hypothetical protein